MTDTAELKSCPFCGGSVKHFFKMLDPWRSPNGVQCDECGIWADCGADSKEKAASMWNRRALEAPADRVETEWQPIETLRVNQSVLLCFWWKDHPEAHFIAEGYRNRDGEWLDQKGETISPRFSAPTHWMRFPSPPALLTERASK